MVNNRNIIGVCCSGKHYRFFFLLQNFTFISMCYLPFLCTVNVCEIRVFLHQSFDHSLF